MNYDVESISVGVIPVSTEADIVTGEASMLADFLSDSSSSGYTASVHAQVKNLLTNASGSMVVAPDDEPSTMGFTTSEEMWYMSQQYIVYDPWGGDVPSYGLQQVEIRGHKLPSDWAINPDISYNEFASTRGGGSGSDGDPCSINHMDIDWNFIESHEGNEVQGKVPNPGGSKSGVTIASGFDLGWHNVQDLQNLGLGSTLINKLTPYLGMKGWTAYNYEIANPLVIDGVEALVINTAIHTRAMTSVFAAYGAAVGIGAFFSLPSEAQTVIASVAFQNGDLPTKNPDFWNQVTTKNWDAAYNNLMHFGDTYTTRRQDEAALLKQAMDGGRLHNGGLC